MRTKQTPHSTKEGSGLLRPDYKQSELVACRNDFVSTITKVAAPRLDVETWVGETPIRNQFSTTSR